MFVTICKLVLHNIGVVVTISVFVTCAFPTNHIRDRDSEKRGVEAGTKVNTFSLFVLSPDLASDNMSTVVSC